MFFRVSTRSFRKSSILFVRRVDAGLGCGKIRLVGRLWRMTHRGKCFQKAVPWQSVSIGMWPPRRKTGGIFPLAARLFLHPSNKLAGGPGPGYGLPGIMKFLHTADWHLGRIFHQVHLTADQACALDQIVEIAAAEKVDAVLVAGDLYDRAVPPPEAVALLDSVWRRLALERAIPVIAIPGNHDSATRVGYGASLLARAGLHLIADFEAATRPVTLGGVDVFALPFAEPAEVRAWSGDPAVRDHASALRVCIDRMRPNFTPGRPRLLVAHAFVAGMRESESERPLSVGGAGTVPAEVFEDFDYVALGHLHAPQQVSSRCRYAGSPLKYSFSEAEDVKSVLLGEIHPHGEIVPPRLVPLRPRRDVRNLEGSLASLLASAAADPAREDYLRITLTDDGALLNALGRLREAYPNVLQLERRFLQRGPGASAGPGQAAARRRESTETELFAGFLHEVLGAAPTAAELALFHQAVAELRQADSESLPAGAGGMSIVTTTEVSA